MKKITNYFKNLPKGVKILLSVNLIVYVITILLDLFFSVNINKYLGVYATIDDRFNPYQIITSIFSHDLFITHILVNLLIFLIYAPNIEKRFGTNILILLYFISGIISFIFSNIILCQNYFDIIFKYSSTLNNDIITQINFKSNMDYNFSIGSSGSISGIIGTYFITNIFNFRKFIGNLIIIFLIISNILVIDMDIDNFLMSSVYSHLSGFTFGIIFSIYPLFYESRLKILNKILN
jgi:membrane associated rhomboid family serine protease